MDGFRFDYGPHILLELPEELAEWFGGLPGLDLPMCTGPTGIAMDARLESVIPAPFQQNLNWLPLHVPDDGSRGMWVNVEVIEVLIHGQDAPRTRRHCHEAESSAGRLRLQHDDGEFHALAL